MADLFTQLFDTLPFASISSKLQAAAGDEGRVAPLHRAPVGVLSQFVTYVPNVNDLKYESKPVQRTTPPDGFARRLQNIWGFDATSGEAVVDDVTCQSSGDSYNRYLVLESLEFGSDKDSFARSVRVKFGSQEYELPLDDTGCLARFLVHGAAHPEGQHWLWPLEAIQEKAVVWVFLYDIELATGTVRALTEGEHPDAGEVVKFHDACMRIVDYSESTETIADAMCSDDLWRHPDEAVPVATAEANATTQLMAATARVLIVCSFTVQREGDDFTPGKPAWSARMYPHIMVLSTMPMDQLSAALKFVRPNVTTGGGCGCDEMQAEMKSMLVADANSDNKIVPNIKDVPAPYWNNLFNYYVTDPYNNQIKQTVVRVVNCRLPVSVSFDGAISRLEDGNDRVTRLPRQGAFDNVHVAPTMSMPPVDRVWPVFPLKFQGAREQDRSGHEVKTRALSDDDRSAWRLDDIFMAPICAHDCFHMHWRWTDDVGAHRAAWGYARERPYAAAGRPMVPENQDVFVRFLSSRAFIYRVQAYDCPADEWQVVCHHGATYLTQYKPELDPARQALYLTSAIFHPSKFGREGREIDTKSWAMFYWNLRWHIYDIERPPEERVRIVDLQKILTGDSRTGR